MNMEIETAIQIMMEAHRGQLDLDGKPEVLHPMAVGLMGKNDLQMKAGFLHDVVEDSTITFEDLERSGAEAELIEILKLLTHEKGLSYAQYVDNIVLSKNKAALTVKHCDLLHNLERGIAGNHEKQVKKHKAALLKINTALAML